MKVTLGPKGRNVVLDKKFGAPTITNDGVTIAREIELDEPFENMGAQLLKEVATKTDDVAGDGTTTAVVLGQALVTEGLKNVTAGANPMIVKRGLDKGVEAIVERLKENSRPVETREQIAAVAAISAADPEVGELIAEVMDKVGKDGVITVEEGQSIGLEKEYTEGMQFDRGYISPYFVTNPDRMEAVLENPAILITDKKISSIKDLLPALEKAVQLGKPLFIVAEDIDGEALATLVVNKLKGTISRARRQGARLRRPPQGDAARHGHPDRRQRHQRGARPQARLGHRRGLRRRPAASSRPRTTRRSSTAPATPRPIKGRMTQIKAQIEETTSDYDREKLQERLAKLAGGVAVIKVGAATEVELKEKKHRIEDALSTTRAAVEEGLVAGGGTALAAGHPGARQAQARGRRGDRRQHPAPRTRGAGPPDRRERRPGGLGRRGGRQAAARRPRLRRAERRVRRHVRQGHRRRGQGDALGAPERGLDRGHGAHDRDAGHRQARAQGGRAAGPATATAATWTSSPNDGFCWRPPGRAPVSERSEPGFRAEARLFRTRIE